MPATRVVIDVQPAFCAANKPNLVVGLTLELVRAMREKAPILIVEYRGSGSTHRSILDLLKGYDRYAKIGKHTDGGGVEVARGVQRNNFPYHHLRVCGVNIDCCVMATVMDMVKMEIFKNSKIEMVRSACEWSRTNKYDWRKFLRHKNVVLAA